MTYKLVTTQAFVDDLDEVLNYISFKLLNPSAAQRLLADVTDKISLIDDNPLLFPLYHDDKIAKRGYRYTVVSNYLLFYRIDETEKTTYLMRFIYGSRNITDVI